MISAALIIKFLLISLVGGILGALGMTCTMLAFNRLGITGANMINAIGSIFTKSEDNAHLIGEVLHFVTGVTFAILYNLAFGLMGIHGLLLTVIVGTSIGFCHGFVMVFLLIISIAEHHPLKKYHEAGPFIAAAYLVGHTVYGLIIGLAVGLSGFWSAVA